MCCYFPSPFACLPLRFWPLSSPLPKNILFPSAARQLNQATKSGASRPEIFAARVFISLAGKVKSIFYANLAGGWKTVGVPADGRWRAWQAGANMTSAP